VASQFHDASPVPADFSVGTFHLELREELAHLDALGKPSG